jgi:predicted membrane protein
MLGYMAFLCLVLYLTGLMSTVSAASVKKLIAHNYYFTIRVVFIFIYTLRASNLFVTTLLGLYYMADRIHRPDPRDVGTITSDDLTRITAEEEC